MKNIIDVKICVGTYSYVMGGADLINLEKNFPVHYAKRVKVSGATEIEGVDEKKMKPPYASVNNKLIAEATEVKILNAIEKELAAVV